MQRIFSHMLGGKSVEVIVVFRLESNCGATETGFVQDGSEGRNVGGVLEVARVMWVVEYLAEGEPSGLGEELGEFFDVSLCKV